jgi:hypothetical protein
VSWRETLQGLGLAEMTRAQHQRVTAMLAELSGVVLPVLDAQPADDDADVVGFSMAEPPAWIGDVIALRDRFAAEDPVATRAALGLVIVALEHAEEVEAA